MIKTTHYWRGHQFDRWDLIAGSLLTAYFLMSFLFHPNGYIKPASCVMYWAFTAQGLYNWYKYRTTPSLAEEIVEMDRETEIGAFWQAEYECLLYDYEEVIEDIDLLLRFMFEQGYSDRDFKGTSSKWILHMSNRTVSNPEGTVGESISETSTFEQAVPQ